MVNHGRDAARREFSRSLPPNAILAGGVVNGTPTDPLTFLMFQVSSRYARLGEEARLRAVGDLLSFGRDANERIDTVLTRFENTRMRAAETGGLALSFAGLAWYLNAEAKKEVIERDTDLLTAQEFIDHRQEVDEATVKEYETWHKYGHCFERTRKGKCKVLIDAKLVS